MKDLNQQLNEIKKSGCSISEKKSMLIKIGMRPRDIEWLEFSGFFNDDKPLTFGVEIECYNVRYHDIAQNANGQFSFLFEGYNHTDRRGVYKFTTDCSIQGNDPRECVSPILDNNSDGFASLENCCRILNSVGARVNKSCGLHVHVGVEGMSDKAYVNIFKNYQKLERLIDSFMAPSRRGNTNQYARTIANYDYSDCDTIGSVASKMAYNRYHKVNPCAYAAHHTIEFRQHQGTVEYEKISKWVNFCCKLVNYSKENVLAYTPQTIWDVPFLNTEEKEYYAGRISHFANEA